MQSGYRRLTLACYSANLSMSIVGNLPPILFLTFRSLYGISYSLLGLLVVINYFTQLLVDLVFSFFSYKFNIPKAVKTAPVLTLIGLLLYALWPYFFPQAVYLGLFLATIIFSSAAGLVEVLISPVIASIPSDNPDRAMSRLHSVYAWGAVAIVLLGTLFLLLFGKEHWQILALFSALVPFVSMLLFFQSSIPEMETPERLSGVLDLFKNRGMWLCVLMIFLGGAAECTMAQWASGYLEQAMQIPKVLGDIFGVALFSLMLGLGRSLYGKFGKQILRVLLLGASGAALCYLIASLTNLPLLGLLACALTGFCTSMLWPGSLVVASDRFPTGGLFIYAMMAAGGDLGASLGPQLVGLITDAAIQSPTLLTLAETLHLLPEQLGMKLGLLAGMLFPLGAIPLLAYFLKNKKSVN